MPRALQSISPRIQAAPAGHARSAANAMFWWAVLAILLQFFLPYAVMQAMGVDADKVKLHPATLLVLAAGTFALLRGIVPFHQRSRQAPGLMLFVCAIPVLTAYSIGFTGYSGSAAFPETLWSAGLLAVMLETATPRQRRLLGGILIALCVANVFIALHESLTQTEWFPLVFDPDQADSKAVKITVDEFRAHAFYAHPLTASLITAMAIFLLYAMRLRVIWSGLILAILLVGLFAFGGRTALAVTLLFSVLAAFARLLSGIVRRNLKLDFALALLCGAIALPLLIAVIVTQTDIADRIVANLYFDESAQARTTQWAVFRYFTLRNWLFGISHDDLTVLKYQIGLGGKDTDIENFWLLLLFDLGIIGFAVFVAAFGAFLYHLGRVSRSPYGWLLVIAALLIDSTSNSLGVKTADLFLEVAFVIAISGYAAARNAPRIIRTPAWDRPVITIERRPGALAPMPQRAATLRLLRARL